MASVRVLTLMGSGETSPTMVKTHRSLLERLGSGSSAGATAGTAAVLLDTPFGFQSNADELTARAQQYFAESVGSPLGVASYRTAAEVGSVGYEQSMAGLRSAGYVFAGPGSPTYALRMWRTSAVPALLSSKLVAGGDGGCVTFASAAALTVGAVTVPVYEIYKVGAEPAWEPGLDLLAEACGLSAAVIPHFNNAEGGTHDTRFCYLGEDRLSVMEAALPDGAFVLGVDEHTGLVLDLDAGSASVVGVGVVTIRSAGEVVRELGAGQTVPIESLRPGSPSVFGRDEHRDVSVQSRPKPVAAAESPLLGAVREAEAAFAAAIDRRDANSAVQVVLDLEAELHAWANETFSSDEMDRARGALRALVVRLGELASTGVADPRDAVAPFVDTLLDARRAARADKRFEDADAFRDRLVDLGVEVRDTADGTEWSLRGDG